MTNNQCDPDYYTTFVDEIPDDETAAEYIYGTHTGFQDREIPKLVQMIKNGEIPERIMKTLRVLALNCHNNFIRYNIEMLKVAEAKYARDEYIEKLESGIQKLKEHSLDMIRIILNSEKRGE